jgi:hypothetical protein
MKMLGITLLVGGGGYPKVTKGREMLHATKKLQFWYVRKYDGLRNLTILIP